MLPTNRIATHPGVFVRENLEELGVTQSQLADHCDIPLQRVNEIVNEKRGITAETAWLFGQAFGTTAEFWMNAQAAHELTKARPKAKVSQLKGHAA